MRSGSPAAIAEKRLDDFNHCFACLSNLENCPVNVYRGSLSKTGMLPCPAGLMAEAGWAGMVPFAVSILEWPALSLQVSQLSKVLLYLQKLHRSGASTAELCGSTVYLCVSVVPCFI